MSDAERQRAHELDKNCVHVDRLRWPVPHNELCDKLTALFEADAARISTLEARAKELESEVAVVRENANVAIHREMTERGHRVTLEARIEELEARIVTDADEAFGPFPVQTAEEALTAIARGVFEMRQERERLVTSRDAGYRERNQLVSALARLIEDLERDGSPKAWLAQHDPSDVSWDPEWRTIVFIDGPTGQLSWHLHDSDVPLFAGLPRGPNSWDGHTTPEKYERLARLGAAPTASSEVGKQEQ